MIDIQTYIVEKAKFLVKKHVVTNDDNDEIDATLNELLNWCAEVEDIYKGIPQWEQMYRAQNIGHVHFYNKKGGYEYKGDNTINTFESFRNQKIYNYEESNNDGQYNFSCDVNVNTIVLNIKGYRDESFREYIENKHK